MKKSIYFVILITIVTLLTGCGKHNKISVDNPLSEEEIIDYIQKQIYKDYEDEVIVSILSKENIKICTYHLDTCWHYEEVDGGYKYSVEITNKENPYVVAEGFYEDGYIIYENSFLLGKTIDRVQPQYFSSNYGEIINENYR